MSENLPKNKLDEWVKEYRHFDLTAWERLPDLELYMDQLINYLGRMLKLQEKNENAPLLTASMVNNYVKAGYVERPQHKKYNKEHIAALYMLCSVKGNLSVPDASLLLTMLSEYCPISEIYTAFGERQREIAEELSGKILEENPNGEEGKSQELLNMALDLTLRATAERLVAERLLDYLAAERGLILARDDDAERAVEKALEEAVMKTAERTAVEKKKAAERKEAEKKKAEKAEKVAREAAEKAEKAEKAARAAAEKAEREAVEKKKAEKNVEEKK